MESAMIGGVNYTSTAGSKSPYVDIYNQYAENQNKLRNAFVEQLNKNKASDTSKANANYDSAAKQNYIKYMQDSRNLPENLNALGVNGGATESSLIRLKTNYGNNVATNEAGRASAIDSLNMNYANKQAAYDEEFHNKLQQAYLAQMENQRAWEQEQKEKDLQYFANSITGRYRDIGSYQNLISSLQSSNDPNKEYKIALAQQAMSALQQELAASSGGGRGGGYRRSRRRGRGGDGSSATSYSTSGSGGWLNALAQGALRAGRDAIAAGRRR